ncbi:unnamed protein product [Rotaria magnacalcarata]|nr:unnamed protein product [Rotaria magnacalcarata]CAF3891523.1 unnamed protein product [Rotaria magnacalcarata]
MTKIRIAGMPNDYGLIEETDLNKTNVTRRIPIKRRLLSDDEKLYGIQSLWISTNSKFVLVKKAEYLETNNNKAFSDKFLFRSITRQKSIDQDSHEDIHVDHPPKQRTTNTLNSNTTLNGTLINNRAALAPTPPIPKSRHNNNNNKRSLKTIFSTIKS